jgi:hypothetical protein
MANTDIWLACNLWKLYSHDFSNRPAINISVILSTMSNAITSHWPFLFAWSANHLFTQLMDSTIMGVIIITIPVEMGLPRVGGFSLHLWHVGGM